MDSLRAAVPACLLWGLVLSGCVRSVPSATEAGGGELAIWEDRRSLAEGRLVRPFREEVGLGAVNHCRGRRL